VRSEKRLFESGPYTVNMDAGYYPAIKNKKEELVID
jgi:hypothetical protein